MKKQLSVLLICMLLISSSILLMPYKLDVKADAGEDDTINNIGLNISYIHDVVQTLSNIVFDYEKGREFGTPGEIYAKYLIEGWMENLSLSNVTSIRITGTSSNPNLDTKINQKDIRILINGSRIVEGYISPRWNGTFYNKLYNKDLLTNNFSGNYLPVYQRPPFQVFDALFENQDFVYLLIEKFAVGEIKNEDEYADFIVDSFESFYDFTFENIILGESSTYPLFYRNITLGGILDPYLFIEEDPSYNPNNAIPSVLESWHPMSIPRIFHKTIKLQLQMALWNFFNVSCQGLIRYDFNNNTYNMGPGNNMARPIIYIKGVDGLPIYNTATFLTPSDYTVSFWLDQEYIEDVESYNVIGQIDGSDPSKIVLIQCLYDSWWNQGTADSAIGIGIMLSIARFFKENNILPKYTIKFIAYGGEEHGYRGAQHYNDTHPDENIITVIDLNQLGFSRSGPPKQILYVLTNNASIEPTLNEITSQTRYVERNDNATEFNLSHLWYGGPSDDHPFALSNLPNMGNRSCNTILFLKDLNWTLHHRDGENHTLGDTMTYYDWDDINLTAEMILNTTKYYAINPDCWFSNISFTPFDSPNDGDTLIDSIEANFTIHTILPLDRTQIQVDLSQNYSGVGSIKLEDYEEVNYTVSAPFAQRSYIFTIPDNVNEGDFSLYLKLYNSTGIIDKSIYGSNSQYSNDSSQNSSYFHLYHPLGYPTIGTSPQSVEDNITGVMFTANEYGTVDNITAYLSGMQTYPPGTPTYKCLIYRQNDSQLIGTSQEWTPGKGVHPTSHWVSFSFSNPRPVVTKGTDYILTIWGDNSNAKVYYNDFTGFIRGRYNETSYGTPPDPADFTNISRLYSLYCCYTRESTPPEILSVSNNPNTVGYGFNVSIWANVTDTISGVQTVKTIISYPGGKQGNFSMSHVSGDMYRYVFSDSWYLGQYNYTIWAVDNNSNQNISVQYSFNVSANATISIATLHESFGSGEYINITDPPSIPDGYHLTGRGLTYNTYYNTNTGCDVLEVYSGPVNYQNNEGVWAPIDPVLESISTDQVAFTQGYRFGNEKGLYTVFFKPNSGDDWPVAFESKNDDGGMGSSVVRMKLLGMGYLDPTQDWNYEVVRSVQSQQAYLDGSSVVYEDIFTGADVWYSYGATGLKEDLILNTELHDFLINHPPSEYDQSEDESYLVFVTQLDYSDLVLYDAADGSIIYDNTTITGGGIDFYDQSSGVFQCSIPVGMVYEQDDPLNSVPVLYRLVFQDGNMFLLAGLKVADLSLMRFPVVFDPDLSIWQTSSTNHDGYIYKSGSTYTTVWSSSSGTVSASGSYIGVGQRMLPQLPSVFYVYRGFVFFNTSSIPENKAITSAQLQLFKYSDYSSTDFDLVVQNGQPVYPHDPLVSGDYNKAYYSGDGGFLNTSGFSTGFNSINLTNFSWIDADGWTKFCLRSRRDIDGVSPLENEYVLVRSRDSGSYYAPKLVVEYSNQSKIWNTGETNISGYVLIQVQYNDSGVWVVDTDAVNETTPRFIYSGQVLALDTIFNGLVQTNDLTNGNGTYRVYAAFRDPDGNILVTDDDRLLAAWYEFEVTGI